MPTNPNIILSGNQMAQPRLPDVNAMMQTRTAGLENIYNIEQQRAAQTRAVAKEQEAAMAEAMLPSVMAAYKNPSDAGLDQAATLMPAEVREHFAPFLSKLKGIPDPATRRSILESELAKDEAGRAVLERMITPYQEGILGVQRGQLDLSRAELEQRRAEAGMPKPMSAAEQARIDLDERKFKAEQEKAAREAEMPEGMDAKTKVKFEQAYPKSSSALRTAVTGMDNTLIALKELIDSPGLKAISGVVGAYTPDITPEARRAAALFNQIKAGAGLAALTELKQASPSGGALGNVSNQEGNTLRDSRGAFLQTQNYDDLRKALIDYYGVLERSKANIIGAFNDTYGYRGEDAAEEILGPMRQSQEKIEQDIQRQFPTAPQGRTSLPPGVTVKRN